MRCRVDARIGTISIATGVLFLLPRNLFDRCAQRVGDEDPMTEFQIIYERYVHRVGGQTLRQPEPDSHWPHRHPAQPPGLQRHMPAEGACRRPARIKETAARYFDANNLVLVLVGNVREFHDAMKKKLPKARCEELSYEKVDLTAPNLRR